MRCDHAAFESKVDMNRITDGEDGPVTAFMADVSVRCTQCGMKFQFLGLKPGLDFSFPTVSVDGLEARLPMVPEGAKPSPLQHLMGFSVNGSN